MGDPRALFVAGDLAGAVAAAPPGHALGAVARGDWPAALALAKDPAKDPADPLALWCRATARLGLGDRPGALADLSALIARTPASPVAWKDRAVLRALLGDREGALHDLAGAAARAPSDVVPHLWALALGGVLGAGPGELRGFGGWAGRLAALVLGEVRVDALLAGLEAEPLAEAERLRRRCQLHGYAGLLAERDGDARAARAHYEACVATERWTFLTHLWARERLVDLSRRPAAGAARGPVGGGLEAPDERPRRG